MYSTCRSARASLSDQVITSCSASTNCPNSDLQSDLIAFLSVVRKYNVSQQFYTYYLTSTCIIVA